MSWPSAEDQIAQAGVDPDSELAKLIRNNQDFHLLRPEEARHRFPYLRGFGSIGVNSAPKGRTADDPTGGYPRALYEVYDWLLSHPNLQPEPPPLESPPLPVAPEGKGPKALAAMGWNLRISGAQTSLGASRQSPLTRWIQQRSSQRRTLPADHIRRSSIHRIVAALGAERIPHLFLPTVCMPTPPSIGRLTGMRGRPQSVFRCHPHPPYSSCVHTARLMVA